jgi:hypothetical protein
MAASETWNDPNRCPFCGAELSTPGRGFVTHLETSDACDREFEAWRHHVADDVAGGWAG